MIAPSNAQPADSRVPGRTILGGLVLGAALVAMVIGAILTLGSHPGRGASRDASTAAMNGGLAPAPPAPTETQAAAGPVACPSQPSQNLASAAAPAMVASGRLAARSIIVRDSFDRIVVNGWGRADVGGPYVISGSRRDYGVAGSGRQVTPERGTTEVGGLPVNVMAIDVRVRVAFNRNSRPGGENRARIILRANSGKDGRTYDYEFALSAPDGKQVLEAYIARRVGRIDSALAADMDTGLVQQPGASFWMRGQISGTTQVKLRLKVWKAGTREPVAWNVDIVDSRPPKQLQVPGHLLLSSYGNSHLPLAVRFDDLLAVRLRLATAPTPVSTVSGGNATACDGASAATP
jgi:hypothetical protein